MAENTIYVTTGNKGKGDDEFQNINADLAGAIKAGQDYDDDTVEVCEYKLVRIFQATIEHTVKEV